MKNKKKDDKNWFSIEYDPTFFLKYFSDFFLKIRDIATNVSTLLVLLYVFSWFSLRNYFWYSFTVFRSYYSRDCSRLPYKFFQEFRFTHLEGFFLTITTEITSEIPSRVLPNILSKNFQERSELPRFIHQFSRVFLLFRTPCRIQPEISPQIVVQYFFGI